MIYSSWGFVFKLCVMLCAAKAFNDKDVIWALMAIVFSLFAVAEDLANTYVKNRRN